ncbi:hypothetical protein [Thiohalomonas denitrificans]|uniref:Aminoglycoside phosphotransferase family enzyme n=1 Tax=Thiohalomonas denitrificans TaxID=415747 RepID=A0A1G5PJ20_9GAMM|nr:hypothetical protein [Thiohalomonas denitrificans]SCZ49090.1 Aminoglycoside phosphotransferase family enzyme [Thiohalomonas denitrificans]
MDLAHKVAFLRQPETYPATVERVEAIETHMSWVFIAGGDVYKLKKPVRYSYLDFRTLDARHQDCLEEVRLNRRLADGVYLGTLPVTARSDGGVSIDGGGRIVDWVVHMRRLPRERMLDRRIQSGELDADELRPVAERLADFYRQLSPVEINPEEYRHRFADDIDENRRELMDPEFGLPAMQVKVLCDAHDQFRQQNASELDRRVADERIIEGHGDLRPQHVCLTEPPVVIDCLEFNRGFRILDAVDELAYLAVECERLGADWAGTQLLTTYSGITGDQPEPALVDFYASFRATLRAKIAIWHNRDDDVNNPDKWVQRARQYLALAEHHAKRF